MSKTSVDMTKGDKILHNRSYLTDTCALFVDGMINDKNYVEEADVLTLLSRVQVSEEDAKLYCLDPTIFCGEKLDTKRFEILLSKKLQEAQRKNMEDVKRAGARENHYKAIEEDLKMSRHESFSQELARLNGATSAEQDSMEGGDADNTASAAGGEEEKVSNDSKEKVIKSLFPPDMAHKELIWNKWTGNRVPSADIVKMIRKPKASLQSAQISGYSVGDVIMIPSKPPLWAKITTRNIGISDGSVEELLVNDEVDGSPVATIDNESTAASTIEARHRFSAGEAPLSPTTSDIDML
mmetsp:Transcript_6154/g.10275  ORF Transcript_6154/g.10275 Transcript_6154/m.10275 type:complete len:296 (-) Transcript_6154:471-1358(-)